MQLISDILGNRILLNIGVCLTVVLTAIFIYLYFSKNGRDERGRGIFATACFISMCTYLVLTNLTAALPNQALGDPRMVKSIIVHMYNTMLAIHLVAIIILRKIR